MKLNIFLVIIFFFGISINKISAQNKEECKKIVTATVDAINSKTPEQLEGFLAPDFTFSGQKAPLASLVLNQLVKQLNAEVTDYRKTNEIENDEKLTLVYEFTYSGTLGQRTTTFVFNKNNQLKQLDLFTIQVKTMGKDETQVEESEQEVIKIPIELRNKIPVAKAIINGESRTFIIDNGSPRLILNSKYFEDKNDGEERTSLSNAQGVNTSISNMDIIQIEEFDFHGIKIQTSNVLTMDIAHLEQELGTEIYGLIGYEIYKNYDMLFDYANNMLTLIQPHATKNYLETHYKQSNIEEHSIEMRGHIPAVKGKIGKAEFYFGVDCGAGSNLLDKEFYISMKKHISNSGNVDLSGAGETKNVKSGNLKKMTIGKKKFLNTNTVFNDMSHLNTAYNIKLNGLVGYEILSKQKLLLSFQNKQLLFID